MQDFFANLKIGATRGLGFLLVLLMAAVSVLIAQSIQTFSPGELITASGINKNFEIAAPRNAVMAFYQAACPTGWVAADGTNGTPDLRGQFIRGLNNFSSAAGTRSDGNQDPDGGARTVGHYQGNMFASHNHGGGNHTHNIWGDIGWDFGGGGRLPSINSGGIENWIGTEGANSTVIAAEGGNETRPGNVALIFCVRKDS